MSAPLPPSSILREVFGHAGFRVGQQRAVIASLEGRDVVVVLPTGGGKSLCYQVPAIARHRAGRGATLVVSPLVALMEDQVRSLREKGVPAVCLHAGLRGDARREALDAVPSAALIYCSPERLSKKSQRDWLARVGLAAVAIDEAHCISEWGHDFRPDYTKLGALRELGVPIMAVTATATPRVAAEIVTSLGMNDPIRVEGSFLRDNLAFAVEHRSGDKDRVARVAERLEQIGTGRTGQPGRAVVYAGSRKRVVSVAKDLKLRGFSVGHYHAGRTDGARKRAQERFVEGKDRVLVATTAFGMGIDVPDIRLVAHVQSPPTLEAYVQQAGRAGRDGMPAHALLLWSAGDSRLRAQVVGKNATEGQQAGWRALQDYVFSARCRQSHIAAWFGQDLSPCGTCDSCTRPEEVVASVAETRKRLGERRDQRRETRRAEEAARLEPGQLDTVVAFVEGMRKPFGKRLVALGLRGSAAKPVKRAKLHEHPLHGALKGIPERTLILAVEQLLRDGRLAPRGKKYPTVWIPDKRVRPVRDASASSSKRRPRYVGLEKDLRNLRRREARRRRWKPYMIFDDATLAGILARRPRTLTALEQVPGMGPKRIERYGRAILDLIRQDEGDPWAPTLSTT